MLHARAKECVRGFKQVRRGICVCMLGTGYEQEVEGKEAREQRRSILPPLSPPRLNTL